MQIQALILVSINGALRTEEEIPMNNSRLVTRK
jgi:hypothetical protein